MKVAGQHGAVLVTVFVMVAAFFLPVAAESISSVIIYADRQCSGTPLVMSIIGSVTCESEACSSFTTTDGATYYSSTNCVSTNRETYVGDAFGGSSYLLLEMFTVKCGLFVSANGYLATGECQIYSLSGANSVIAKLNEDGSANLAVYNGTSCSGIPILSYAPDSDSVSSHSCFKNYSVFYASTGSSTEGSASLSTFGSSVATSTNPGVTNNSIVISSSSPATNIISNISKGGDGSRTSSSDGSVISIAGSGSSVAGLDPNGSADEKKSGSQSDGSFTVSITPPGDSGGISTGAIIGILVAYVVLCVAACMLCMDKMEKFGRRLCSRG